MKKWLLKQLWARELPCRPSTFCRNTALHKSVLKGMPGCHGPHVLCKVTLRWHFGTQNMHPIYPWLWWKLPSSPCRFEPWDLFTYIYIQKGFLKTSENEPDWTSCPISSQGSINYTFTPLFGINSNFSLSSDHNSLYFNTAINNQFEVDFKIF